MWSCYVTSTIKRLVLLFSLCCRNKIDCTHLIRISIVISSSTLWRCVIVMQFFIPSALFRVIRPSNLLLLNMKKYHFKIIMTVNNDYDVCQIEYVLFCQTWIRWLQATCSVIYIGLRICTMNYNFDLLSTYHRYN